MEYLKTVNIEYSGDYSKQMYEKYREFIENTKKHGIKKSDSIFENIKICAVKDIDFINYFEYSEYTIVLVKSEYQVTDNYDMNMRNYLWFKDDKTLLRFFDFLLHIIGLDLDVSIDINDVFAMLIAKANENVLAVKEISESKALSEIESDSFLALYCSDLGIREIYEKIELWKKFIKCKDYNIILGVGSNPKIDKEFIFCVIN